MSGAARTCCDVHTMAAGGIGRIFRIVLCICSNSQRPPSSVRRPQERASFLGFGGLRLGVGRSAGRHIPAPNSRRVFGIGEAEHVSEG